MKQICTLIIILVMLLGWFPTHKTAIALNIESSNTQIQTSSLTTETSFAVARDAPEYSEFKQLYNQYFEAWNTAFNTTPEAPAQFYAQEKGLVFYDPSPTLKGSIVDGPIGWTGLRDHFLTDIFPTLSSFRFGFANNDDLRIWHHGNVVWTSLIWHVSSKTKDGQTHEVDGRQSNIFERRNGRWLIVHEHASLPMPNGVTKLRSARIVTDNASLPNRDMEFQRIINDYAAGWHAQNGNPPDWDRIASFYAKDPDIVLIDMSPFQPQIGFAAFRNNAQKTFFDQATFWVFAVNNDVQATRRANLAWTTFTFRASGTLNKGQTVDIDGRQSNVWERRDGRWVIVHEHGSAPQPN